MRLEDEIQVKAFSSPQQKLHVNLLYTYSWITSHAQAIFKPFGITMQQYNIMRILRGQYPNPCTIQLLKDRMIDKQSDVSRLVDRLRQKALLHRRVNALDRRKMDVVISQIGLLLLDAMEDKIQEVESIYNHLSEEEIEQMNALFDKIRS